jgi:Rrf2 family protein
MKLSTRARYGLKMMLQLARGGGQAGKLSISEIARQAHLSRRYLEQLAIGLKNASLITATTGREGGYRLARSPEEITLREIIEACLGPVNIVDCVGDPEACIWVDSCECRPLYTLINERITGVLDDFSLADMASADWAERVAGEIGNAGAPPH